MKQTETIMNQQKILILYKPSFVKCNKQLNILDLNKYFINTTRSHGILRACDIGVTVYDIIMSTARMLVCSSRSCRQRCRNTPPRWRKHCTDDPQLRWYNLHYLV